MKFVFCILILAGVLTTANARAQPTRVCFAEKHPIHRMARYVFEQIYQQAGIKAEFVAYPNKRSLLNANEGYCSAEIGRISRATEIFTNLRIVPTPFFRLRGFAYFKKGSGLEIDKWADLKDYRVAIRRGEIYATEGTKEFAPIEVGDYKSLFKLIENGRIDVAIGLWVSALNILSKPEVKFQIKRSATPLHEVPFYHLVHKDSSDLNNALNTVLIKWQKSGRLKREVDIALEKLANGDL